MCYVHICLSILSTLRMLFLNEMEEQVFLMLPPPIILTEDSFSYSYLHLHSPLT